MKKKKGAFIVIDGTDGSGKATQVELLRKRLAKEGKTVKIVDFPEYYKNFFGRFVGECLTDPAYGFAHVHPKIASVLYAADRFESKKDIERWLEKGYVVLANRYVSSNQIHQGGKIIAAKERREFLRWLDDMEFRVFGIPRPDTVIYLSVPVAISRKLMKERDKTAARAYKGKKKDAHESDRKHLENARASALKLVKELTNFIQVDCAPDGTHIDTREAIAEKVYAIARKVVR